MLLLGVAALLVKAVIVSCTRCYMV